MPKQTITYFPNNCFDLLLWIGSKSDKISICKSSDAFKLQIDIWNVLVPKRIFQ